MSNAKLIKLSTKWIKASLEINDCCSFISNVSNIASVMLVRNDSRWLIGLFCFILGVWRGLKVLFCPLLCVFMTLKRIANAIGECYCNCWCQQSVIICKEVDFPCCVCNDVEPWFLLISNFLKHEWLGWCTSGNDLVAAFSSILALKTALPLQFNVTDVGQNHGRECEVCATI